MHNFYYTYKITLLKGSLTGHYYFGKHITKKLNDGYAGSGRIIRDYFKKYPKIEGVTYVKEILHFYNDEDELNEAEEILIGDLFEKDNLCLNLCRGGKAPKGFKHSEETRKQISNSKLGHNVSDETRNKISCSLKGYDSPMKGKHLSKEAKEKIREFNLGKQHSEETKLKLSESLKGYHWKKDPETGKRIYYKNNE